MTPLESLVSRITQLTPAQRDREEIKTMKRAWCKEQGEKQMPTNIQLLKTYYRMVEEGQAEQDTEIENLLRKRSVRSMSGIVPIQVLTKPFRCPGECIFCPTDATMPKSYINTQPGAMRALLNQFDPYKQTYNRLLSLTLTGHATDKIEMIVLGGTRDVYPQRYKTEFVKGLYDACNTFDQFMEQINIDYDNPKAARWTAEDLDIKYPESIEESLEINETAKQRIIGLTVETRPEYVNDENCQYWRSLGVTRIEMGIQTLHNDIHELNKRGHDNEAIRKAMHTLRQYGFKVSNHYMPGLYGSSLDYDIETFELAYSSPRIKSDEQKFYPTAVIPNTGLYDLYKAGDYEPLNDEQLETIVRRVKTEIIPPYTRIKRLARDFDTNEVVAGANTPNLRQLVMRDLHSEYAQDVSLRKKQYSRLCGGEKVCHAEPVEVGQEHQDGHLPAQVGQREEMLDLLSTPMDSESHKHTSLSGEERELDDRMETYALGTFDTESERNFVCLCTRCREMRNKKQEKPSSFRGSEVTEESINDESKNGSFPRKTAGSGGHIDHPFLVVRRYRSSVGEELFVSFEDSLGYLYGFTRLLLPEAGQTVERDGLGTGTAMIRELHVYGKLAELDPSTSSGGQGSAQHKGYGSQLLEFAAELSTQRGYERLSVISGIGVKKYYEKQGYAREGTYMVKEL